MILNAMLRLAETRDSLNVVGDPTLTLDIADSVIAVAAKLIGSAAAELRGIFHMTGSCEATWADFAEEVFAAAALRGMPGASVGLIPSS